MKKFFKSQDYGRPIYKHKDLSVYRTDQFNFYRCIEFQDGFYDKTVSELHSGNLRICTGRYAKLFAGQKLSYWANSPQTARAEIKKHGATNDILTFWAYDDASSTFPTLASQDYLTIIDGRESGIQELIDKVEEDIQLNEDEQKILQAILEEKPDCLSFDSHAAKNGENFLFFEKGFKKLAIREANLRLGNRKSKNHACICCATTCDYDPCIESYGKCFLPIAKTKMLNSYLNSDEYKQREEVCRESLKRLRE